MDVRTPKNDPTANPALTDPAVAANLTPTDWVALHVPRFLQQRLRYVAYEGFLKAALKEGTRAIAPLAIVEARAKGVPSFAEKILRKKKLYVDPSDPLPPDPLARLTDLCGGRVILHTVEEVKAVCDFIERAFVIDWANSDDASQRLKPAEFGYRSFHYIVSADPDRLRDAGITTPVPPEIIGLRAEVQVRTLLEHASADIGHDTIYKSDMRVPDSVKRDFAALAAVLEGADREFGRLVANLQSYKSNFGSWHPREEVEAEIERLRIVLSHTPKDCDLAVRIARLAQAIGEHELAIEVLEPYRGSAHAGVVHVLGMLLTGMHWDHPNGEGFRSGVALLEQACAGESADVEALWVLAECRAHDEHPQQARHLFHRAVKADPTDPVALSRYLEFEIERASNTALCQFAAPMIKNAIARARRQIEARVNLPRAWSALAVLHLLVGEHFAALAALGQVALLCTGSGGKTVAQAPCRPCAAGRALQRTRGAVERLRAAASQLEGFDWFERFLMLLLATRLDDAEAKSALAKVASKKRPPLSEDRGIVILAGGCAPDVEPFVDRLRPLALAAIEGLELTLISGGTRAGVSGLAGDMAAGSGGGIRAIGYLPKSVPHYTKADEDAARYAHLCTSPGSDFTPMEPLQAWTDLVVAGVSPSRVKLLCYAPGDIARSEIRIALALGGRAGLIEDPTLPKARGFDDPHWTGVTGFLPLPMDASTLRVFVGTETAPLPESERERLEPAAKMAHADYVKSATPKDPSLQPWDKLDESLRESNFQQVAFWEKVLAAHGLKVRKQTDAEKRDPSLLPPLLDMAAVLDEATILRLAQLEHGRWNVERLAYGWRYAREKDVPKRLSPYLVPWGQVPEGIQQYDIDAIVDLPQKLREAGMEIEKT